MRTGLLLFLLLLAPTAAWCSSTTDLYFTWTIGDLPPKAQDLVVTGTPQSLPFRVAVSVFWVAVTPMTGSTPATISLQIVPGYLPAGNYDTVVTVSGPTSPAYINVHLTVLPALVKPTMSVSPPMLDAAWHIGDPVMIGVLQVYSSGGLFNWTATAVSATNWLVVQASGTAPSPLAMGVRADVAPGAYYGTVYVSSKETANTDIAVPVRVGVFADVVCQPRTLTFNWRQHGPPPPSQTVSVSSTYPLSFTGKVQDAANHKWLQAASSTSSIPSTILFSVDPGDLEPGTYNASYLATVSALPPVKWSTAFEVTVTLQVTAAPTLSVNASQLSFDYRVGDAPPAPQTLSLSSSSAGLAYTATARSSGWLEVSPAGGTTPGALSVQIHTGSLASGTYAGEIEISANAASNRTMSIPVSLTVKPDLQPHITPGGVMQGATFGPVIGPGAWITIFGANLSGSAGRGWSSGDFVNGALPLSLDGTSVRINHRPAPIAYASAGQLNVLAPEDDTTGLVAVEVTTATGTTQMFVTLSALAPGLFTLSKTGNTAQAAALHADGRAVSANAPARPGEVIMLFGTGFGATNPPRAPAQTMDPAPLAQNYAVVIGGQTARGLFGGVVGPGLYQFNVEVPQVADGDQAVAVYVGAAGAASQGGVTLPVRAYTPQQ